MNSGKTFEYRLKLKAKLFVCRQMLCVYMKFHLFAGAAKLPCRKSRTGALL